MKHLGPLRFFRKKRVVRIDQDITTEVFHFLSRKSLDACSLVCKKWLTIIAYTDSRVSRTSQKSKGFALRCINHVVWDCYDGEKVPVECFNNVALRIFHRMTMYKFYRGTFSRVIAFYFCYRDGFLPKQGKFLALPDETTDQLSQQNTLNFIVRHLNNCCVNYITVPEPTASPLFNCILSGIYNGSLNTEMRYKFDIGNLSYWQPIFNGLGGNRYQYWLANSYKELFESVCQFKPLSVINPGLGPPIPINIQDGRLGISITTLPCWATKAKPMIWEFRTLLMPALESFVDDLIEAVSIYDSVNESNRHKLFSIEREMQGSVKYCLTALWKNRHKYQLTYTEDGTMARVPINGGAKFILVLFTTRHSNSFTTCYPPEDRITDASDYLIYVWCHGYVTDGLPTGVRRGLRPLPYVRR